MAALSTKMITEILSRLRVKSVARFKCVCKTWNCLIKTPNFIKFHLNETLISNSDRHLLFCYQSLHSAELNHNHISFSEVQLPLSTQGIQVFGSCNDIICIGNKTEILLFNQLTKSHFKLPIIPDPNRVAFLVRLFGFGYDSKNDDYKVLKLVQWFPGNDMGNWVEAELYSRNNNSWKSVQGVGMKIDNNQNNLSEPSRGVNKHCPKVEFAPLRTHGLLAINLQGYMTSASLV